MKRMFFLVSAVALVMVSCDSKLSINTYHEKVIKVFNASAEKMATEREILFEHNQTPEEDQKIIEGLNANLDECIKMMNEINYPYEAKDFHEAMLKIYTFQKDSIMPLLSETLTYKAESKEWYSIWREFDNRTKRVDALLRTLDQEQRELARKANAQVR